jgi:hypothetical protein
MKGVPGSVEGAEQHVVSEAPRPGLARLERTDDRMIGGVVVGASVTVR